LEANKVKKYIKTNSVGIQKLGGTVIEGESLRNKPSGRSELTRVRYSPSSRKTGGGKGGSVRERGGNMINRMNEKISNNQGGE